jgi:hypothetical protein
MATKKTVPQISPVPAAEAALTEAKASEAVAQKALLAADPSEVLAARDRLLVAEAATRKAERDLAAAKATEADRDRAARLSALEDLIDDQETSRALLAQHAAKVAQAKAALAAATKEAHAAADALDERAAQAAKQAAALGVPFAKPRRARYFAEVRDGNLVQGMAAAGTFPALLLEAEHAAGVGVSSENALARAVCAALGTRFPKGPELEELRACGVTDKDLIHMAWEGLARFYSARASITEAHQHSKSAHFAHRHTDVVGRLLQDLANLSADHDKTRAAPARAMLDRLGDEPREGIQWADVDAVCRMVPHGSLVKSLSASERTAFAGKQPTLAPAWSAADWIARNVVSEESAAAE